MLYDIKHDSNIHVIPYTLFHNTDTAYSLVPQTCKAIEGGIVPTKDPGETENSVYLWKYGDST